MGERCKPTRGRRGFIFLFGSKNVVSVDPDARAAAAGQCPRCGAAGTLVGKRVRPWFTLFFVPVFPMGGGRAFTQCRRCNASFNGATRQVAGVAARTQAQKAQRAITLYNGLRASPANSVTLAELIGLYLSLGEPEQAVGAAADFPDALNASDQCIVLLGLAYGVAGRPEESIHWFDTALARNPESGDAYFQRAKAYLSRTPPDIERALADARAARRAGQAGADELLRQVEARGGAVQ